MATAFPSDPVPIVRDTEGTLRIGESRVLLDLVIRAFQDGATPEAIAQRYATVALADVYAVIAFYLRHPEEINTYLLQREQMAGEFRQKIEQHQQDLTALRHRLRAQRAA